MKAVTRLHNTSLTSNQALANSRFLFANGGILRANMKTNHCLSARHVLARVPRLGVAAYCDTPNAATRLLMVAILETFSNLRPVSRRESRG